MELNLIVWQDRIHIVAIYRPRIAVATKSSLQKMHKQPQRYYYMYYIALSVRFECMPHILRTQGTGSLFLEMMDQMRVEHSNSFPPSYTEASVDCRAARISDVVT